MYTALQNMLIKQFIIVPNDKLYLLFYFEHKKIFFFFDIQMSKNSDVKNQKQCKCHEVPHVCEELETHRSVE